MLVPGAALGALPASPGPLPRSQLGVGGVFLRVAGAGFLACAAVGTCAQKREARGRSAAGRESNQNTRLWSQEWEDTFLASPCQGL